ncbi:anthocyanidin reductase ((2S)-flavan-3-ol-forming) [Nymphaea colorata]|nr:anthocyanidin reductase ((2S)-flavan-3-ol-forming) [Nymphaea colorata]
MATVTGAEAQTACVTGANGYMASILVKQLLDRGYTVHATVRDAENQAKVAHLVGIQGAKERLKLFSADITVEGSLDLPVSGCDYVFHTATPVHFESTNPEKDMIEPAVQGTLNVLKACLKAKSVKRVVLTSSAAAVTLNKRDDANMVMDETCWTDTDFLYSEKPPTWGYPASKTLAEQAAWKFAEENNLNLVSVIPVLMTGPSITTAVPSSVMMATALVTGNDFLINNLKGMQMVSGSISIAHVEDVCRAHIFVAEEESVSGRYICCAHNTSVVELAHFLSNRYPEYKIPTDFGDFPAKAKLSISTKKLVGAGFNFKHGIESIFDESVEYLKSAGVLPK